MSDPQNDQSQYRHPWRNEEEESVTVDTNVQKEYDHQPDRQHSAQTQEAKRAD